MRSGSLGPPLCVPFRAAARTLEVGAGRCGEPELSVQAVSIFGVQHPAKPSPRTPLNHRFDQRGTEPDAACGRPDEHVGQIGHRYTVGHGASEADHRTIGALIRADYTPGAVGLGLHIRGLSPAIPIRIVGSQKRGVNRWSPC